MSSIGIVLLIVGFCFYLGILYSNQVMLTIGFALLLLMAASLVEVVYRYFTLNGFLEVPISMTESGRPVTVRIRLLNKSILPAGKVEVCVEHKNLFGGKLQRQWLELPETAAGESRQQISLTLQGAGCHEIKLSGMKIHSSMGLLFLKKPCEDYGSVVIMPEVYPIQLQVSEAVRNFLGDADIYDEFRPGHDAGETFEIRGYREKDKLQSIHWKLSARMEELMVKEHSLPKACAIVLMLQLRSNKQEKIEEYLNLAASLSYTMMDLKCPHFVAWYSKEKETLRRIRVDDEESFYTFLNVYLRDAKVSSEDVRGAYREAYKNEWYLGDIMINEQCELYQNGEFVTNECKKLELLL